MCELYEVVFFTASISNYADKVLNELDPEHKAPYRLFRQHCTLINSNFVKNLSQLGRDLKDVIIVDNLPSSFSLQPCNGIPISTWIDDKNDKELDRFVAILEPLSKVDDIRDYLREVVRNNELDYLLAVRLLGGEVTLKELQMNPSAYWTNPKKKIVPPKDRTQSQKKLISYSKDNNDEQPKTDESNPTQSQNIDTKNLTVPKELTHAVLRQRAQSISTIIKREALDEIGKKDKLNNEGSLTSSARMSTGVRESTGTPIVNKSYKSFFSHKRSSQPITPAKDHIPSYYFSKDPFKNTKPEKSTFNKGFNNVMVTHDKLLNIILPPRSSNRLYINSYTPKPITNLSSKANSHMNGNYVAQEKASSSLDYHSILKTPTQASPPIPPPYPQYNKSTIKKYSNAHLRTSSFTRFSHVSSDLIRGCSTTLGMRVNSVSREIWKPKAY